MLPKKTLLGIAAVLLLAGTAIAAASVYENDANATMEGKNWRGRHFAPFEENGTSVEGRFVSFDVDPATGAISNYTAKRNDTERLVFTSVSVSPYDAAGATSRTHGAVYASGVEGQYRLAVFDARNAAMFVHAKNATTITYVVADGITIEYHAGEPGWSPEGVLMRDAEDHTARLVTRGNATVSVDGQTITVALEPDASAAFHLDGKPRELAAEHWLLEKLGERGPRGHERDGEGPRGRHPPMRGERDDMRGPPTEE